jgi:hypothetical protein
MTNIIHIFDGETSEVIEREMTVEESSELNEFQQTATTQREARIQEQEEIKATKISAYKKLGLTDAEIEAFFPTPKPDPRELLGGN